MKKVVLFLLILFLASVKPGLAVVDPLTSSNNKYGIHITDENDLGNAANLVNSSGGDWGYVTMVITDNDLNKEKWQKNFDTLRNLHLIPIIRLATHPIGDTWAKPKPEEAKKWADFLGSLYWVTKNRYVVIFNEPNHTREWGGAIAPDEYARVLSTFSLNLKKKSSDFFILPAGLDASAPNSSMTMDETNFLRQMFLSQPDIFSYIDGWTSHSYPNPGFSGKVTDSGRGTLRTYLWELDILKSFGVSVNLPVFVTETGWAHEEGLVNNNAYLSADTIAAFMSEAARNVWNDSRVTAVTPFILNYQSYPFANFSWQKPAENSFYPFFDAYKAISKLAGRPKLNTIFDNFDGVALQNLGANENSEVVRLAPHVATNLLASLFYRLFNL